MESIKGTDDLPGEGPFGVFAFGSNLDLNDFTRWCRESLDADPVIRPLCRARLRDHALVWNYYSPVRQGGAANIDHRPHSAVCGMVFEVDKWTLLALDKKEGHPARYRRERVVIESMDDDTSFEVWTYRVTPDYRESKLIPPTRAYLDIILKGIESHGLPDQWRAEVLDSLPE